ncbi:hypothetical protein [Nesterenkonia sp. Act20]|uniref:hypothetical protein n=1 Tax=Nesterenkonia sp. Act20 TaxID=1483432 RepID=UPI001C44FDC8|nr:hypothetical protein [Nesterenkonia sp. Act20]
MEPFIWRDAEVTYPDWSGTAQLDERKTNTETIDQRLGLGENEHVVGLDIGGGERHQSLHVIVAQWEAIKALKDGETDELEVTDYLVHDVDPFEFLRSITHGFELRMRTRVAQGKTIRVTDMGDIPQQD